MVDATGTPDRPTILAADHVSWTVAELEPAVAFYRDVLGAEELFRLGPLDAADMPAEADGRDWMAAHVGVAGAKLTLVMMRLAPNLNFQLVRYDKPADRRMEPPRSCEATGRYLAAHGCEVMAVIEAPEGPLAGKKNLYVRDPFGNSLEIVD